MATATHISLEQYLKTTYEPDAEYVNGEVEERHVGEYEHTIVQRAILIWFHLHDKAWHLRTLQEQRTRLISGNVRIPDVSIWRREVPVQRVFSSPQLIAIEVLSPEDRHSKIQEKIDDYRTFGVPYIWVIDPIKRVGWDCSDGNWIQKDRFEVTASPIYMSLTELFRELDISES